MSDTTKKTTRKQSPKGKLRDIISRIPDDKLEAFTKHVTEYCLDNNMEDCIESKEKTVLEDLCRERNLVMKTDCLTNAQIASLVKIMEKTDIKSKPKTKKVTVVESNNTTRLLPRKEVDGSVKKIIEQFNAQEEEA